MLSIVVTRGEDMRRALESFFTALRTKSVFQSKTVKYPVTPPARGTESTVVRPAVASGVPDPPPPDVANASPGPFSPTESIMARCTQSMPVSSESLNVTETITASMTTCESWMSSLSTIASRYAMSEAFAEMMSELECSSARIEMLSGSTRP